ncbi:MAG: metallophosphoesterase [Chthonomonadales bacterium]
MRLLGRLSLSALAAAWMALVLPAGCRTAAAPRAGVLQTSPILFGPWIRATSHAPVVVSWYASTAQPGKVEYERADSRKSALASAEDPAVTQEHHVRLAGLKAGTAYRYRIEIGGWRSSWYTFYTAPAPGKPFRFVVYGDTRSQPRVHAQVIQRILHFRPELVVHTGDLVADGRDEAVWSDFWRVVEPLTSGISFLPALGNHERNARWYYTFFGPARDYSFDYGNVHFSVLDTNRPPSEYEAQEQWLKEDLTRSSRQAWHVLICHHTPVTCIAEDRRRVAAERLLARLEPILKNGHVQVVFSGHDHNYQRHEVHGITYVVTGGGGAPLYDVRPDTPYVKVAKKAYNECEIQLSGHMMHVRAVEPDGTLIDEFTLRDFSAH